jgi:hypothetical protein
LARGWALGVCGRARGWWVGWAGGWVGVRVGLGLRVCVWVGVWVCGVVGQACCIFIVTAALSIPCRPCDPQARRSQIPQDTPSGSLVSPLAEDPISEAP